MHIGPTSKKAKAAFESISHDLATIESRIRSCFPSDAAILSEISAYLLDLGGKRIRPAMAVLCSRLFGATPPSAQLVDAAAGIELIHMATLLHDDIIDASPLRRRHPSAFAKFGLAPTLLAGDFLLVKAFGICAGLDRFVVQQTEQACIELTEGEVLEGLLTPNNAPTIDGYTQIIGKKTASLFRLSSVLGAYHSPASEPDTESMAEFGWLAGIAFQMIDDILDITADDDLLGKPAGTDLRQKTPSLVNLLWLSSGDPAAIAFFASESSTEAEVKRITSNLRRNPIVDEARAMAKQYVDRAQTKLASVQVKDEATRDGLCAILEYTLDRCL